VNRKAWSFGELKNAFVVHYFAGVLNRFLPLYRPNMPFFALTKAYCPHVRAEVLWIYFSIFAQAHDVVRQEFSQNKGMVFS